MHLLRNLARACLGLLKELKQEQPLPQSDAASASSPASQGKMRESSCWIIITTIATVWKQRDLWIDAEDLLRKHLLPP
jgi:Survival motor neuron (SMN) interacting protein 1 (SIP1)